MNDPVADASTISLMGRRFYAGIAACVAMGLMGCSGSVDGNPVGIQSSSRSEVRVDSIEQAVPDESALSTTVGSPVKTEYQGTAGGVDVLPNGMKDASPAECLGVRSPRMRQTYQDAPVAQALEAEWETISDPEEIPDSDVRITVGVIELDSPASARSWYTRFVSQWQKCQGQYVTSGGGSDSNVAEITRVVDADSVLSAVVAVKTGSAGRDAPMARQRALTLASRFIVDVGVVQIGGSAHDLDPNGQAIAVARLIANRIVATE